MVLSATTMHAWMVTIKGSSWSSEAEMKTSKELMKFPVIQHDSRASIEAGMAPRRDKAGSYHITLTHQTILIAPIISKRWMTLLEGIIAT